MCVCVCSVLMFVHFVCVRELGTPHSTVITAEALKWWNSLVRIISSLRSTHTLFTFPLGGSFTPSYLNFPPPQQRFKRRIVLGWKMR